MKRKDFEEVYDEFADFALSSPATKIRRLDAELPPMIEEGEPTSTLAFCQQLLQGNISAGVSGMTDLGSTVSEAVPAYTPNNEERAIVLYKPVEAPVILPPGPTNVSLRISSDRFHGLKNHVFELANQSIEQNDEIMDVNASCFAVVPWVPSQAATSTCRIGGSESRSELSPEAMEAEEAEAASMEVEEVRERAIACGAGGEGFVQWRQHCMTPQLPPNTSIPIMWSW